MEKFKLEAVCEINEGMLKKKVNETIDKIYSEGHEIIDIKYAMAAYTGGVRFGAFIEYK